MPGSAQRYPAYKDSGVPWLGEVPEHWEVLPNRALFVEVKNQNHPDEPLVSVTITRGVIPQERLLTDTSKKDSSNLDKSNYKLVQPGDVAYNKMRAWQGAIGVSRHKGIVSPAYIVQRPRPGLSPEYVHHLMRTPAFAKEAERWSYGITSDQWSLRAEHFKMIYSVRPPIEEQSAIVRFLGHVDRKIQRAIRAKQKLIKLLEEEKQVLIHRAVTGQIDVRTGKPYPAYKSSGVQWLGDVPAHWSICKVKFEMSSTGGGTPSKANADYWNGSIPWVSPKDMKSPVISDAADHITERAVQESSTHLIPEGAILLVVRSGILRRTIPIAIGATPLALNQDMKALMSKGRIVHGFFVLLVFGCEKFLLQEWTKEGATVESIEHQFFANSRIPVPPSPEQVLIIDEAKKQAAGPERLIKKAQGEISLLREYRTRLVADVVTGKLDVREAAASLPAEPEAELESTEPEEDLDLPQAAEEEGSYGGGQEED